MTRCLATGWILFAMLAARPAQAQDSVNLVLEDQFGNSHSLADHKGDVVILLVGDRSSGDASRALGEKIHVRFHPAAAGRPPREAARAPVVPVPDWPAATRTPDATAVAVACIGEVPSLMRGYVKNRFKSASPDAAVWLDVDDTMRKQFATTAGVPNVLIFDTLGRLRYRYAGNPDAVQFAQICAMIDGLRAEARPH